MKNMELILELCQEANISVLIKGVHGIGKSKRAENYAINRGYHVETLFLSHQETGDLIGIPYLENGVTVWSSPVWLERMKDAERQGKRSVLFLDELNRARIDVRQSALQLVLSKQIHQHHLPTDTLVIAAINPEDDYQVAELDIALSDRFLVLELKPDTMEWIEWAVKNTVEEVVINFIADNPDKLWFKTENELNYPTPRSWVFTSNFIKIVENKQFSSDEKYSILLEFLKGKVGISIGLQFLRYYMDRDDFNIDKIEKFCNEITSKKKRDIIPYVNQLKPLVEKVEIIKIQYIVHNLIQKYIPITKGLKPELGFEKAYPLMLLLYSLSLEVLHSVLKSLKESPEKKEFYTSIIRCDSFNDGDVKEKHLINRILDKMNANENK